MKIFPTINTISLKKSSNLIHRRGWNKSGGLKTISKSNNRGEGGDYLIVKSRTGFLVNLFLIKNAHNLNKDCHFVPHVLKK